MIHRSKLPALRATLAAVAALTLAAAVLPAQAQSRGASANVGVRVVDGEVRVSTDNAVLAAGVSTITWQMGTEGWRFAAGSIDFGDAAGYFSCRVFNDGAAISCNRSASAPRGQVAYTIRLSSGGALTQPPQPYVYISLE